MSSTETWSNDALTALKLRLVRDPKHASLLSPEEQRLVHDFEPTFVYPIFGQEESIFGYSQDLQVDLRFASGSLKQLLQVSYSKMFPPTDDVKADDPESLLYEFIPPDYSKREEDFIKIVEQDSREFKPIGIKVGSYKSRFGPSKGKGKGKVVQEKAWMVLKDEALEEEVIFEAYSSNWETPGFKEYHRRMQIFVLLYIEGAQYIDEDDARWEFVTLFERRKVGGDFTYHFAGFVSFYSFFCWPDTKRLRLAQFVVLPPYQGQGHGSSLYSLCYRNILNRPEISELTVEDPSEPFEDMRDKLDLSTLLGSGELDNISAPFDKSVTESIRRKFKLAERQFYRVLEMILLINLDPKDQVKSKAFRLSVKKRLYLFNKEVLASISDGERKVKLQETYEGVEKDYRRLIQNFL